MLAVLLLIAYFAAAPVFDASAAIETAAGWVAASGGDRLTAAGIAAGVAISLVAAPFWGDLAAGAASGLQTLAGHAGHDYADDQGALAMLPAFQLGLFVGLLAATRGVARAGASSVRRSPRWVWGAVGALALGQAVLLVALGELSAHYGLDPHVALFRAWAIVAPLALVWLLRRPVPADGARGDQEWRAWRGSSGCSCASR